MLSLIDEVPTIETNGETDPHWWQNPRNAILAVAAIRDRLAGIDPGSAAAFRPRTPAPTSPQLQTARRARSPLA